MTVRRARRRGEPLMALSAIILCWVGVRVALWPGEHPVAWIGSRSMAPMTAMTFPETAAIGFTQMRGNAALLRLAPRTAEAGRLRADSPAPAIVDLPPARTVTVMPPVIPGLAVTPGLAGGHAMLWLAAVGRMPSPAALLAATDRLKQPQPAVQPEHTAERRWSADAWALMRSGGGGAVTLGPSVATYGGSQVGAVLRYRLAPASGHRPTAYLRASAALNGSGEREAALGLSVRPIAALPVVVAGEGRVGRFSGRMVLRPAVVAVTELPPLALPQNARAELYLQGGYVGGRGATPFIDGQLRIDRKVARVGPVDVRAGAGAWVGAQRGAARLDVGPSATLGIAQGTAAARVGIDWRFRIEGSATPASGPALTISAGF
jgi:hypothetical protein